jgi:D-alanyl-lipoteichoic acid acyltransferase DltB (MBOAT superfamily)
MLFNSIDFFYFLPVVLIATACVQQPWRNRFLLIGGYYFYGSWDWRFIGLLFLTTVFDFYIGRAIYDSRDPARRRWLLVLSICVSLGVLGFFKYFNFFLDSAVQFLSLLGINASGPALQIILPVGVSFYTFQSMAYVIDIYRGVMTPAPSFLGYATYVSYFPQLVAGPIERPGRLLPQILAPGRVTTDRINLALSLLVIGYAKKVLIADTVAPEVDRIFAQPEAMSSGMLLRGAYLFTLQIYGDFSGYSDIARGVSELFGVRLMVNFNQPYLSLSITEFWRRWHISLSTWLRDYLYIPLGGNRGGSWMTYRNLLLTMLIGGLWHGANWTFVVWGGVHGLLLAVERAIGIGAVADSATGAVTRFLRGVLTFHLVVFCWIFFRAPDVHTAFSYLAGIAPLSGLGDIGWMPLLMGMALLVIDLPQWLSGEHTFMVRVPWWVRSPVYAAVCFLTLGRLLWGGAETPFIYFQF